MGQAGEATVNVRVLGPLSVERDGVAVDVGGPRARAILTTLAHQVDEVVSVDSLMEVLWRDDPPKTARNVIQVQVSNLRRSLGAECELRTHGSGYSLSSHGLVVDVDDFEREVRTISALIDDDPSAALDSADRAIGLWRGDPAGREWETDALRSRLVALDELRLSAEVQRLDTLLRLGRHPQCCAGAEALTTSHPYREDVRALHMAALYRSGRQTEALAVFRATRELLVEELGLEPGPELRSLHRQILDQDPGLDPPTTSLEHACVADTVLLTDNLAPDPNTFVDRPEVDATIERLVAGRVITVVGTGGIGKSRCVAAMARRCRTEMIARDGVWLVDLTPLPDDSPDIAATVADSMGLGQEPGVSATTTITSYLAQRSTLVVLDNCEHVAEASRRFVTALCTGAPSTAVLAASRVRLGSASESVVTLGRLPDDAARELLAVRIAEVGAGPFSEEECDALCAVLDNYPLAIELAAARTRAFSPREVATRLARQPTLLAGSRASPDESSRPHADLATALQWSLDQLSSAARDTLIRATVFVSDFDLATAEEVLATDTVDAFDVVAHLGELVEHHLVSRDHSRARFRVLEPIRQHLRVDDATDVQQRYIDRFADFAIEAAVELTGPDEARWWDRFNAEFPHIRESVRLLVDQKQVERLDRIFTPMAVMVNLLGFVGPGEWAVDALRRLDIAPSDAPGIAAAAAAHFAHLDLLDECDEILEQLEHSVDDPHLRAILLSVRVFRDPMNTDWGALLLEATDGGDPALAVLGSVRAREWRGVDLADAHGNPTLRVFARQWRSVLQAAAQTDMSSDEARRNKEELYRIALTSNNPHTTAEGQMFMALQHCHDGDALRAGPLAVEMIERMVRVRSPHWVWHGVEVIAIMLAMVQLEPHTSEKLWAAVTESGRPPFSRVARNPALPAWVASQLTDNERAEAIAVGSTMTMDVAVVEARKAAERMAAG